MPKCICCEQRLMVWGVDRERGTVTVSLRDGLTTLRELELTPEDARELAESLTENANRLSSLSREESDL